MNLIFTDVAPFDYTHQTSDMAELVTHGQLTEEGSIFGKPFFVSGLESEASAAAAGFSDSAAGTLSAGSLSFKHGRSKTYLCCNMYI